MKINTTILALGISLAVVTGLVGSAVFSTGITTNKVEISPNASALFTGHVTTIHRDASGNIVDYRQTDNRVLNQGENCALKLLFQTSTGSAGNSVCTGSNTQGFKFIQIGNSSAGLTSDQIRLVNPHNSTSFGNGNMVIGEATSVTWTNSTGSGSGTTGSVVLSRTFTNNNGASGNTITVSESGLFNSTADSTNAMFARQTFNTVTLSNGDSLSVQWTISVGGTTNALTP